MEYSGIMVSVYCLTYKHAKYLNQTLDGFAKQKTNFRFEVIIHDDASNDGSKEIIYDYCNKYPDIFIPIIQEVNQYSQKIDIIRQFILPKVRGKYVAICEGDDFWTDENKLQMQVDALEYNTDCNMALHKVVEISENGIATGFTYPSYKVNSILSSAVFIDMQYNYSFQTSSFFMRSNIWKDYIKNPPLFKQLFPVGDVPLMLYFGDKGKTYYIDKAMSCYRRGVKTSYTTRTKLANSTIEKQNDLSQRFINALISFDSYSQKKYHKFCVKKIALYMGAVAVLSGNTKIILSKENKEYYNALDSRHKFAICLTRVFPLFTRKIFNVRRRIQAKQHYC